MKIIGLAGRAGSGKTTAAEHLETLFSAKRLSIAMPIKEYAIEYFGQKKEDVYLLKPASTRMILQGIGKMFREQVDPRYFLDILKDKINIYKKQYSCIVIDDIRLMEEAFFVLELGGIIIKLECPNGKTNLSREQEEHFTEAGVDLLPYTEIISAEYGSVEAVKHNAERIAHEYLYAD